MNTINFNKILREQVCEAIYTVIPEVPRLVELFHNWSCLDYDAKQSLDREVESWNSGERIELYLALKDAFNKWELIQDTEGAPGCDRNSVQLSCNPQLEEQLMSMMINLESMVNNRLSKCSGMRYQINAEKPMTPRITPLCPRAPHTIRSCLFPQEIKKTRSLDDFSGHRTE